MLHPDFPIVEGEFQMTDDWALALPEKFNRRVADGDLVIWRPGFTMQIAVWNNDKNETARQRLSWTKETASPEAYHVEEGLQDSVLRLTYRLAEDADDDRVPALYCYAVAKSSHIQMAFYFDDEEDLALAERIWRSLRETGVPGVSQLPT